MRDAVQPTSAGRGDRPRWGRAALAHRGALVLFAVLTLSRCWPLTTQPAARVPLDLTDAAFDIWAVAVEDHAVMVRPEGLWSLFHGNIYYPTPHALAYATVTTGLLPLSLPLHALIGNVVVLTNVLLALGFVSSAYGAFLLGLQATGAPVPALVAGLVFGFLPLRDDETNHLLVMSTQWMVLAAFFLVHAWRRPRVGWWACAGIFLGLCVITNLYYGAYLAGPLLVVALLRGRTWTAARFRGAAVACLLRA